jgi:hypothetical protein
MHLKPTGGCQISTLIFEKIIVEDDLYEYPMKNISRTTNFLPRDALSIIVFQISKLISDTLL